MSKFKLFQPVEKWNGSYKGIVYKTKCSRVWILKEDGSHTAQCLPQSAFKPTEMCPAKHADLKQIALRVAEEHRYLDTLQRFGISADYTMIEGYLPQCVTKLIETVHKYEDHLKAVEVIIRNEKSALRVQQMTSDNRIPVKYAIGMLDTINDTVDLTGVQRRPAHLYNEVKE